VSVPARPNVVPGQNNRLVEDMKKMENRFALVTIVTLFIGVAGGQTTQTLVVSVPDRSMDVPVEMRPDGPMAFDRVLCAVSKAGDQQIILQRCPSLFFSPTAQEVTRTWCAVLPKTIASGRFALKTETSAEKRFSLIEANDGLSLSEGGRPVFVYRHKEQLAAGVPEKYRRATYIHPLYDLRGNVISDDFPKDHLHHRGLSWTWAHVGVGGEVHDLWAGEGVRQVFEKWLAQETGPVCATIGVKNAWWTAQKKIMDEWVWIRAFPANEYGRAIDVLLTLKALEPIDLSGRKEKGYSGFGLRYGPRQTTIITTPQGKEVADSDLKPLPWADETGNFGGATALSGAAIFQHSGNPRFPAGWCLRHYGFIGVSWPGVEIIHLEPGKALTLRFRVWVHDGDAKQGKVQEAYDLFAQPPALSLSDR
jgi:hypothetical protein